MKKLLLLTIFCLSIFACQKAENTVVENKNTNANYNQNTELQKIRNQLKQQSSNYQKDINTVQNQIEQGSSNIERNSIKAEEKHENTHDISPETR